MENQDITNYVMSTPGNTNPAVLNSMLGELNGGGSTDTFLVEFVIDLESGAITCNKSYVEIEEACKSNKIIYGYIYINEATDPVPVYFSGIMPSLGITPYATFLSLPYYTLPTGLPITILHIDSNNILTSDTCLLKIDEVP